MGADRRSLSAQGASQTCVHQSHVPKCKDAYQLELDLLEIGYPMALSDLLFEKVHSVKQAVFGSRFVLRSDALRIFLQRVKEPNVLLSFSLFPTTLLKLTAFILRLSQYSILRKASKLYLFWLVKVSCILLKLLY